MNNEDTNKFIQVGTLDRSEWIEARRRVYSPEGICSTLNSIGQGGNTEPKIIVVGRLDIKGKQYPIKLIDGDYIIRKLTVSECKRLQTVPEWYEFPVSDTQAYKMLGNGWTVDVITHLIESTLAETT